MEEKLKTWQSITSFSRIIELFLFFSVRHFEWMEQLFWVIVSITTLNTLVSAYWLIITYKRRPLLENAPKLLIGFSITCLAGILVLLVLGTFLLNP